MPPPKQKERKRKGLERKRKEEDRIEKERKGSHVEKSIQSEEERMALITSVHRMLQGLK